jgi:hypothetical protein
MAKSCRLSNIPYQALPSDVAPAALPTACGHCVAYHWRRHGGPVRSSFRNGRFLSQAPQYGGWLYTALTVVFEL